MKELRLAWTTLGCIEKDATGGSAVWAIKHLLSYVGDHIPVERAMRGLSVQVGKQGLQQWALERPRL